MDFGASLSFCAAPYLNQPQTAAPVPAVPWSPAAYAPAAVAAAQQPLLGINSSCSYVNNSYLVVRPQPFSRQQILHSSFLPFGSAVPVQPQPYLDPFLSGAGQQLQVPQPVLPPPLEQQVWQHQQQLPQQDAQQQEQLQLQQQDLQEPEEDLGDLCDLLDQVEQQYELDKQSQQLQQEQQGEPPGAAGAVQAAAAAAAAAVGMTSVPRPYEVVYDRDRRGGAAAGSGAYGQQQKRSPLYSSSSEEQAIPGVSWRSMGADKQAIRQRRPTVRQQQQQQDRQVVPRAMCIPVMQLAMPPAPYLQQTQPQHLQQMHVHEVARGGAPPPPPPWATPWAASVSHKHPNAQLPARLVVDGTDSSSGTLPWWRQLQQQQQQQELDSWQYCEEHREHVHGVAFRAAAAADLQHVGRAGDAIRRRYGSSQQQQQQPSASARAAAMLQHASSISGASGGITGGAPGQGCGRNSPEAYFRRHVQQVDPVWASATPDDVGLVGVTQLQPAPAAAAAAGSGGPSLQSCTMSVLLTNSQLGMVKAKMATLQLVCLLVGDAVPHRCQWPPSPHLTVNGQRMHVKTARRIGTQQLKPTQVDSLMDVTCCVGAVASIVQLSGVPSSSGYVLGARLVRKQGLDRVKALMAAPPSLEAALTAVKDKLAGDGDVEVSGAALPLRCPLSGGLISQPARFQGSPGLDCFDLDSFLQVAQASGKWQCPQTMALRSVGQLTLEPYLAAVLKALRGDGLGEGVESVEVAPDGRWRPKGAASGSACPWFSVLQPPSASELRAAFRGEAGGGIKRRRSADSDAPAAVAAAAGVRSDGMPRWQQQLQRHKQQRRDSNGQAAGAAGSAPAAAVGEDCVDLTLDSDSEGDPAAAKPTAKTASGTGAGASAGRSGSLLRMPGRSNASVAAAFSGAAALRRGAPYVPYSYRGAPAAADSEADLFADAEAGDGWDSELALAAEAAGVVRYSHRMDDDDDDVSEFEYDEYGVGNVWNVPVGEDEEAEQQQQQQQQQQRRRVVPRGRRQDRSRQQQQHQQQSRGGTLDELTAAFYAYEAAAAVGGTTQPQQQQQQRGEPVGGARQHAPAAAAAAVQQRPDVIDLLSDSGDD